MKKISQFFDEYGITIAGVVIVTLILLIMNCNRWPTNSSSAEKTFKPWAENKYSGTLTDISCDYYDSEKDGLVTCSGTIIKSSGSELAIRHTCSYVFWTKGCK